MTDTLITQCPHCHTRFNLQPSQLKAAQGAVRCGICREVFNASSHCNSARTQPVPARSQAQQTPLREQAIRPELEQLRYLSDEPLRLDWQPKKNPWQRWLGWGLVNALAILLLVGQYTYHNFTQLARQDSTRPWLAALCPLLGCQLPAKVDVQQIKSSNLVVRKHPEFSAALLVDAIIYNRAPFSQPFPLLELTFSDQHGQRLASRLFKPVEHLSGELAEQQQMPQQTPIHIALEILEPKGGADNYSLSFLSPD